MTVKSASSLSVVGSATLGLSPEGLRSLLSQIEAQLYHSEVYRRSVNSLESMLGETEESTQMLVKAVGREAIRLALQQFVTQYQAAALIAEPVNYSNLAGEREPEQVMRREARLVFPVAQRNALTNSATNTVLKASGKPGKASQIVTSVSMGKSPGASTLQSTKKLTKEELATQKAAREWEESLHQVGIQLREARLRRSLSLNQLHAQTHIPLHHIVALEAGCIEQLPEDIYIRGFIRRLSEVLGLDSDRLLASLPAPDPEKSVLPSWYQPKLVSTGFYLRPAHLYLGYTALIAGAVGGLAWISERSPANAAYEPQSVSPQRSFSHSKDENGDLPTKPGLQSSQTSIIVGSDHAPPETLSVF